MSRSLEVLSNIYKPYRITKINSCIIMNTMDGDFVVKENKNINYQELYKYLNSRSFNYFPKLISDNRDGVNVFEYVEDISIANDQKALDLTKLIALLHSKTVYFKEVTNDKYKEIYENVKNNILYMKEIYSSRYDEYIWEEYMCPSHYLFMRNYSLIFNACNYTLDKLDIWYSKVNESTKQRVCLVHNDLKLEHYIKNENDYLISWDKYTIDTPVMDLFRFYQNEWNNVEFSSLLEMYDREFGLLEEEKLLLDILISIPYEVKETYKEIDNCRNYRLLINYLGKSSKIVVSS